ncbi:MAG: hypothetical protein JSW55_07775 [Chloroflexota bacterium]|nr:MAG: hypothetical protein JSW55_07775 [Chloroflexota bacterium]
MEETQATAILILMFALRCIAPLLLTLAIGYLMNRLVDRWQAEDAARVVDDLPTPQPAPAPGMRLPTITVPCWILRNCDEAAQADCPARKQPGIPCWLARLSAEGRLPDGCPDCPIYEDAMPAPAV